MSRRNPLVGPKRNGERWPFVPLVPWDEPTSGLLDACQ
eukprot:CAMPEP_0197886684 /NCGR_PEP_ID=MMETSP1439-20131203/17282_1 /TAXON_ID=66791 /ORGANISM="Gonyaulax spinifera, Strain CCMP409" /LENGTH=37 /DNA_ID= /DNA_START= /DNA_END= /DNA_ORIENTATION=